MGQIETYTTCYPKMKALCGVHPQTQKLWCHNHILILSDKFFNNSDSSNLKSYTLVGEMIAILVYP